MFSSFVSAGILTFATFCRPCVFLYLYVSTILQTLILPYAVVPFVSHRMWITLSSVKMVAERVPHPARRHVFDLDRVVRAGAIRVLLSAPETSVDELEAYSLPVYS